MATSRSLRVMSSKMPPSGDGTLVLGGAIRAWGVTGGGTLTISTPGNILIGDNAPSSPAAFWRPERQRRSS